MEESRIKSNIKTLNKRLYTNPSKFFQDKVKYRFDISLVDYYNKLNKYYTYIDDKIEKDVLKTAKTLFKEKK